MEMDGESQPRQAHSDAPDVLDAVRFAAFRHLRLLGAVLGLPVTLLLYGRAWLADGRPLAVLPGLLIVGVLVLVWTVRRETFRRALVVVVPAMAALPIASLWAIGPGFGSGAGALAAVFLAGLFLGSRAAAVVTAAEFAAFVAFGLLRAEAGRVGVGGLWSAPAWVFWNGIGALGIYLLLVVVLFVAVLASLGRAVEALRAALAREAGEREARLDAERRAVLANRLEAIGRLAGGVAHDTRNALTVLGTGLQVLREAGTAPDRELLEDMARALAGATETMRQLITLGGGSAGEACEIEAAAVVERFARAFRRLVPAAVTVRAHPLQSGRVRVREALLEQALLNLCLNARDAMADGGEIRLGVTGREGSGGRSIAIEVADQGPGLPPGVKEKLFQPFVTTKEPSRGTGLGLAMVDGFASGAGGKVEVDSAPGRGTTFRIVLPLV